MTVIDFAAAARRRDQLETLAAAPTERVKAHNDAVLRRAKLTKPRRARIAAASVVHQRNRGLL